MYLNVVISCNKPAWRSLFNYRVIFTVYLLDSKRHKQTPYTHTHPWEITRTELQKSFASWSHHVSKSTTRRHLYAKRLSRRLARKKKPFQSYNHKHECLEFARLYWDSDWKRSLYGQTKQTLSFICGWLGLERNQETILVTAVSTLKLVGALKYGGRSITSGSCLSSKDPEELVRINVIIDFAVEQY